MAWPVLFILPVALRAFQWPVRRTLLVVHRLRAGAGEGSEGWERLPAVNCCIQRTMQYLVNTILLVNCFRMTAGTSGITLIFVKPAAPAAL